MIKPLTLSEKLAFLRLIRTTNVGPITFYSLINYFGSAEEAIKHLPDFLKKSDKKIKIYPLSAAEKEMENLEKIGGELISFKEPEYPKLLSKIPDAPPLISVIGNKELLNRKCISIVGTRDASLNGRGMAERLGFEIANAGAVAVSGMALGIDASAHEGALASENPLGGTIAVLGTGVDVVYPQSNRNLYDKIKEKGLLLSEFPLTCPAQQNNFPRRNRIIAGLSLATVVVEAKLKSGSLITAKIALDQGRDIYAIPGNPLDSRSHGTNRLIKDGAYLVETPEDVLEALNDPNIFVLKEEIWEEDNNYEPDFSEPEPYNAEDFDLKREKILALLGNGAVCIDELIRQSEEKPSTVSIILVELELAGKLERLPGNAVSLLAKWE